MMLFVTRADVEQLEHFAALAAANKLGIEDAECKRASEIKDMIRLVSQDIADALDKFTKAYLKWYSFHEDLDNQGKNGNLGASKETKLQELIENRDSSRQAYIDALAKIASTLRHN